MKKIIFYFFTLTCFSFSLYASNPIQVTNEKPKLTKKDLPAEAPLKGENPLIKKIVSVNGMVCSFCANSIEKKLKKQKSIKSFKVDFDSKSVEVLLKPGQSLSDKKLKKLIKSAGFSVVSIKQEVVSSSKNTEKQSE